MVAIIRLNETETRKWAWSLIDQQGKRASIELLDVDRAPVEHSTTLAVFVAELASLYRTSFATHTLNQANSNELSIVAVGRVRPGTQTSRVDWRHLISPIAVLRTPKLLHDILDTTINISAWSRMSSGGRSVQIEQNSDNFIYKLLAHCHPEDAVRVKNVIDSISRNSDPGHTSQILAQERDAIISAMKISGIDEGIANLRIGPIDNDDPTPFLSRLNSTDGNAEAGNGMPIRQHEDSLIGLDARNFLDWISNETGHAAAMVFRNEDGKSLTVINANRLGIELAVGADLVYYNPTCRAYVLVQYKMLTPNGNRNKASGWTFRPDKQFLDQMARMQRVEVSQSAPEENDHEAYRLGTPLTYFKFCRHDAGLDSNVRLIKGNYVPSALAKLLLTSLRGPRNGQSINGGTLRDRGLDNSAFVSLVRTSLIGSSGSTTEELHRVIAASLAGDRSIVFAMPE